MVFPQIAAFARLANGAEIPKRVIAGQPTKLSRAMHDIQYDEMHDEMIIANPFAQAILTYRGGANGEEPPIRVLQGPHTQMVSPDFGVEVDPIHDEIFVAETDSILVFPRTANGDAAPIRVLGGPNAQLNGEARALSVDPVNNLLVVSSEVNHHGQILIFNRTDAGDVKPRAVIAGPATGIRAHINHLRVYGPKGWIVTTIGGGGDGESSEEQEEARSRGNSIAVWSIHDKGDIPPRWLLGGAKSAVRGARIALNRKAKEVVIGGGATIRTWYFPEIF